MAVLALAEESELAAIIGISGGVGISTGAGISIGGSASAGISASEGAFSGLRLSSDVRPVVKIDTNRFIQPSESVGFATSRNASFQVGGQAEIEGSASLSTNRPIALHDSV